MREKIEAIQSLLAAAKEENEFGGSEDADGCLHPGDVNWDELEERIICILEDREWTPLNWRPKPSPPTDDFDTREWVDINSLPLDKE